MADALFIRPDDTRLLSYVESNYDNDQVSVLIYDTQQMDILPLIGTGLYDELSTQITANTLTALNTTLLTHLRPAVRMAVLANGVLIFNYKIRNKGVQTMSSDNAQPVGLDVIDRLTQNFKDQAQVYSKRVHDYLWANIGSYPLFANAGSTIDTIHPKTNQFFTGWVMDNNTIYNKYPRSGDSGCTLENPST